MPRPSEGRSVARKGRAASMAVGGDEGTGATRRAPTGEGGGLKPSQPPSSFARTRRSGGSLDFLSSVVTALSRPSFD